LRCFAKEFLVQVLSLGWRLWDFAGTIRPVVFFHECARRGRGVVGKLKGMELKQIAQRVGLGLGIAALFLIGSLVFKYAGEGMEADWSARLTAELNTRIRNEGSISVSPGLNQLAVDRLREQLHSAHVEAQFHLDLVRRLYGLYFMQVSMFLLASALAAIALVFVSRDGWKQANDFLLIAFSVLGTGAVVWGTLPGVFKMADNIDNNKNAYVQCLNIGDKICTYLRTYKAPVGGAAGATADKAPEVFIAEMDDESNKARDIYLLFDISQSKSFNQITESLQNASAAKGK